MARYEEKAGFRNITEIRNFLCGLKNTAQSKPYLKVAKKGGYYYLCVYLDNNFSGDTREGMNGFREWYQLRMNKEEE